MLRIVIGVVFVAALAWRMALLLAMPCVSPDGAKYCMLAQGLAERGIAALREPEFEQHPLFPLLIVLGRQAALSLGAADGPLAWQFGGQIVAMSCGAISLLLVGVVSARLARVAAPELSPPIVGTWAVVLAALLPLGDWLAVDVMSEHLLLVFYLGGCAILLRVADTDCFSSSNAWRFALAGLLASLAFLTRPEGAVLVLAGTVMALGWQEVSWPRRWAYVAALWLGFAPLAGLYAAASGGLSPKLRKEPIEAFTRQSGEIGPDEWSAVAGWPLAPADESMRNCATDVMRHAALDRLATPWYFALPIALYETGRAGRLAIPLLAIPALIAWRRRLARVPAVVVPICAAVHVALISALQWRSGYLDPRHTLVIVMILLIPAAAGMLAWWVSRRRTQLVRCLGVLAACAMLLCLGIYSLRVPQQRDGFVRSVATWIAGQPGVSKRDVLLGGATQRRIAFYAGVSFRGWAENLADDARRDAHIRDQLTNWQPPPRWWVVELGKDRARARDSDMLERLLADPRLASHLSEVLRETVRPWGEVRVYSLGSDSFPASRSAEYNPQGHVEAATSREASP